MEFRNNFAFLSNMHYVPHGVVFRNQLFHTVENAFQAAKCQNPERIKAYTEITPVEAKRRGRHEYLRSDWDTVKFDIMFDLLKQKFAAQPNSLWNRLLDTRKTCDEIIETNHWHDNIWGACDCKRCENKIKHNILGHMLTDIRDNTNTWRNFLP